MMPRTVSAAHGLPVRVGCPSAFSRSAIAAKLSRSPPRSGQGSRLDSMSWPKSATRVGSPPRNKNSTKPTLRRSTSSQFCRPRRVGSWWKRLRHDRWRSMLPSAASKMPTTKGTRCPCCDGLPPRSASASRFASCPRHGGAGRRNVFPANPVRDRRVVALAQPGRISYF